jgi:soluble lytic murein transglycosylase
MRKCPVHYRRKRSLLSCLLLGMAAAAITVSTSGLSQDLNSQRQTYTDAVQAIDRGHWTEYAKLRPGLDDYPLAIYLDFLQLIDQPGKVQPA